MIELGFDRNMVLLSTGFNLICKTRSTIKLEEVGREAPEINFLNTVNMLFDFRLVTFMKMVKFNICMYSIFCNLQDALAVRY